MTAFTDEELRRMVEGPHEVFSLRQDEWQVRLGKCAVPTIWNSQGAALSGMKTEMRRLGIHQLSRDCWCGPEIAAAMSEETKT